MLKTLSRLSRVPPAERNAIIASLVVSVIVAGLKFYAYFLTQSAGVFSDALESIVNVLTSGFAIYALGLAHEPADRDHPYGHGKVEFLSAAIEGGMIFGAGAIVIFHAVLDVAARHQPILSWPGYAILAFTAVANALLGIVLVRVGRRKSSLTLEGDGRHVLSDVVTTAGVLAALGLVHLTGWGWLDPACGAVVGLYLVRVAYTLLRRSTAGLMDEQDSDDDAAITALLNQHVTGQAQPKICSFHKLRHRHAGRMHWVDFHMRVPRDMTVQESHQIACFIEREIEAALGEADATAHVEPCGGCNVCGEAVES